MTRNRSFPSWILHAMTHEEALQQAMRRWGDQGYVRHETGAIQERFAVGIRDGVLFYVKGSGSSWEEAFATADGNVRKPA